MTPLLARTHAQQFKEKALHLVLILTCGPDLLHVVLCAIGYMTVVCIPARKLATPKIWVYRTAHTPLIQCHTVLAGRPRCQRFLVRSPEYHARMPSQTAKSHVARYFHANTAVPWSVILAPVPLVS